MWGHLNMLNSAKSSGEWVFWILLVPAAAGLDRDPIFVPVQISLTLPGIKWAQTSRGKLQY